MKEFTEHLRTIQFTLLSLCFIGLIFALFPNQTTLDRAKEEARIVKLLYRNFDELVKAPFDDTTLEQIDSNFSEFAERYLHTTYQVEGTQRYIFSQSSQCAESEGVIFIRQTSESQECSQKLFVPMGKGTHLNDFIQAYDRSLSNPQVQVPITLDLGKVWIKGEQVDKTLVSDIQTLGEVKYEGFFQSVFLLNENAAVFFTDEYGSDDASAQARLNYIQNSLKRLFISLFNDEEIKPDDTLPLGRLLEAQPDEEAKQKLDEIADSLWDYLITFGISYAITFESAQQDFRTEAVNIEMDSGDPLTSQMFLKFTSVDLLPFLCDVGYEYDLDEIVDCDAVSYESDFIESMLAQTLFDSASIAVGDSLAFEKSESRFMQALEELGIDTRRYNNLRLGNSFAEVFPNFLMVTQGMPNIKLNGDSEELDILLKSLEPIYAEQFSVFGAQINSYYFGLVAAVLIMMVSVYFNIHWREFVRRFTAQQWEQCAPWVGVYLSPLARSVFVVSVTFLPLLTSAVIAFTSEDERFQLVAIILLVLTLIVSISTLIHIIRFWKKLPNAMP